MTVRYKHILPFRTVRDIKCSVVANLFTELHTV